MATDPPGHSLGAPNGGGYVYEVMVTFLSTNLLSSNFQGVYEVASKDWISL